MRQVSCMVSQSNRSFIEIRTPFRPFFTRCQRDLAVHRDFGRPSVCLHVVNTQSAASSLSIRPCRHGALYLFETKIYPLYLSSHERFADEMMISCRTSCSNRVALRAYRSLPARRRNREPVMHREIGISTVSATEACDGAMACHSAGKSVTVCAGCSARHHFTRKESHEVETCREARS